jgi:periplasmic protein TonB
MARKGALAAAALAGLAACAPPAPVVAPAQVAAPVPPPAVAAPPDRVASGPYGLDDYKRRFAGRIAASNSKVFHQPLPQTMKSIVVLYIRVDRRGRPVDVSVFRSNGYRALERRAVASVADAAPLPAPPGELLDDRGSLSFLETFLFRDDGLFQVRSLVGETWKASEAAR